MFAMECSSDSGKSLIYFGSISSQYLIPITCTIVLVRANEVRVGLDSELDLRINWSLVGLPMALVLQEQAMS